LLHFRALIVSVLGVRSAEVAWFSGMMDIFGFVVLTTRLALILLFTPPLLLFAQLFENLNCSSRTRVYRFAAGRVTALSIGIK
jgi:hypothetical protein